MRDVHLGPLEFGCCCLPGGLIGLLLNLFWLWMLVDCLLNESSQDNTKLVWAVVIILLPVLGAALYFFLRRPERRRQLGR